MNICIWSSRKSVVDETNDRVMVHGDGTRADGRRFGYQAKMNKIVGSRRPTSRPVISGEYTGVCGVEARAARASNQWLRVQGPVGAVSQTYDFRLETPQTPRDSDEGVKRKLASGKTLASKQARASSSSTAACRCARVVIDWLEIGLAEPSTRAIIIPAAIESATQH